MLVALPFMLYYIFTAIVGFFIGLSMFQWLNRNFDIYYFGIAGVIATFGTCWGIATVATYFLGGIALVILVIGYIIKAIKGPAKEEM